MGRKRGPLLFFFFVPGDMIAKPALGLEGDGGAGARTAAVLFLLGSFISLCRAGDASLHPKTCSQQTCCEPPALPKSKRAGDAGAACPTAQHRGFASWPFKATKFPLLRSLLSLVPAVACGACSRGAKRCRKPQPGAGVVLAKAMPPVPRAAAKRAVENPSCFCSLRHPRCQPLAKRNPAPKASPRSEANAKALKKKIKKICSVSNPFAPGRGIVNWQLAVKQDCNRPAWGVQMQAALCKQQNARHRVINRLLRAHPACKGCGRLPTPLGRAPVGWEPLGWDRRDGSHWDGSCWSCRPRYFLWTCLILDGEGAAQTCVPGGEL